MPKHSSAPFLARKRLIVIAISTCFSTAPAWANPTGPQVINGSASIAQTGKLLTVTNSNGAIINWNSFSIAAGESTRFNQASAASGVLNRVTANDPSVLLGTLSSNGKVWLVNPAGILVGQGARIDVAGFVASTLNIRNEDFLAGRLNFQSTPNAGALANNGQISTPSGGSVYLIAPSVTNKGVIDAPGGEVLLAAGQTVQLLDTGTPGVKVEITGAEGSATNLGRIVSDAGRIGMAGVLVKNSGELNASSVVREGGRVFLRASRDAYVDGAGRIVTTGTKGGSVDVLGERVAVMDQAQLDASGTNGGGQIRVGGDYQGKNAEVQNADRTFLGPHAAIKADATLQGDGGKVIVWADDTTRAYGTISAKGGAQSGNGGFVETSGHRYLDVAGIKVDTSSAHGSAGNWLLDPTDISIVAGSGSGSFTGGVFDNGGGTSATVYGGDISTALNTTNVTIQTSSGAAANGDITVTSASVANNSNSARTLTLRADRSIAITGSTISGNSTGGSLGVTLNAAYGGGAGNVSIQNSTITTYGGAVVIGGGADPKMNPAIGYDGASAVTQSGVYIYQTSIVTGGGALAITGTGFGTGTDNYGIYTYNAHLDTSGSGGSNGGVVTLTGTGGAGSNYNYGVYLYKDCGDECASILTGGGDLNVTGTGGGVEGENGYRNYGIYVDNETLDTSKSDGSVGGKIKLKGTGGNGTNFDNYGVSLVGGATTLTGGGKLEITGVGGDGAEGRGINIYSAFLDTRRSGGTGGEVSLDGTAAPDSDYNGYGVELYGSSIITGGGALGITGNGVGTGSNNYGIYTYNSKLDTSRNGSTGGAVTLNGTGGSGSSNNYGVYLYIDTSITTGGGALDITGSSGGTGYGNYGIYTYRAALDTGKNDGSTGGMVTLAGTGGNGTYSNIGVLLDGGEGGFTRVRTGGGSLDVTGTGRGTGNDNNGINTYNSTLDTSTGTGTRGGDLILSGNGSADAVGTDNHGVYFYQSKHSSSGDLRINGVAGSGTNANAVNITNGVVLRADSDGTGSGKVIFGSGNVVVTSGNHADIYYNPDSYAGADTTSSDATHNPYSAQVTGPGTYTAWMLVNDATKLQAMNTNLAGNYALGRNIDASGTSTWNGGQGFAPVGPFAGQFDGLMQVIKGLTINRPSTDNVGLFGQIGSSASVKNVGLAGGSVIGKDQVGALAGNNQGSIYNAYGTGTVNGSSAVGGLAGTNSGSLENSYTSGTVSGAANVGGLLGHNEYGGSVSLSYAIGSVSGSTQVGGLVGRNEYGGSISTSYATGSVPGAGTEVGGLVGRNDGAVSAGFWDTETSGTATGYGGGTGSSDTTGLSTANAMLWSSYSGWSSGTWWISDGNTRPFLRSEWSDSIQNAHQLQLMATNTNSYARYQLANNIDLQAELASGMWGAKKFVPVGSFYGQFNGMNHTISNLVINRSSENNVGLFSYVGSPGVVKNIGLVGGSVTGANYVGDLVGDNDSGSISNSYANGSVTGSAYAGGLVGYNHSGSIRNSYSAGAVTSSSYGGGLVGWNEGTIYDTYSIGAVTAPTGYGGGLVGYDGSSDGISNSYWNTQTSGQTSSSGGVGKTSAQMSQSATFSGWSIADSAESSVWRIYEGQTTPLLRSFLKPITVTASDASKVYDKLAFGGNGVTYSVPAATLSGAPSYSGAATTAFNVGSYAINASGLYSDQQGYDIGYSPGTLSITPRSLSVTATGVSKVYDATTNASVSLGDNRLAGDTLTLGYGSASFDDKNVGVGKAVNVGSIVLTGTDNYILGNTSATTSADITRAILSLGSVNAAGKVYDGTLLATVTGGTLSGVLKTDVVSILTGTGTFADKNVGAAKTVSAKASDIKLTGADSGNYALSGGDATGTADITVRPLSTWIGAATGDWSVASNWDALPDLSNVLAVTIPTGKSVTYDAAAGSASLASLNAAGLSISGGSLNIANELTVNSSFSQTGGTLAFGIGASASITQASGNLNAPGFTLAQLSLNALAGAITQSGPLFVTTLLTQSQGATTLDNANNHITGRVDMAAGGPITLAAAGDLNLGAINAGANAVTISAGGAMSQAGTGTNIIAGSATLTSVHGGVSGGLAIVADTQVSGALSATVGSGAAYGGISIQNIGTQPSSVTLVDNALAGASVGFLDSTDITDTANFSLKTLNGGDLSLLSGGHLTWTGGSMSTPSGSAQLGANGNLNVTGALSIGPNVDLSLSAGTGNAVNISGSVSTAGSGTIALTAPTVNITGSVNAGDDVGSIATSIILGPGSSINAGHDVIFAATDLTANNASVVAAHDISAGIAGNLRLNASSFVAGNDIFLTLLGPTSTLYLNDTAGLSPSYLWAKAIKTVHLEFPGRTSGGVVVDGTPVDLATFVTPAGGSGFFFGPAKTPAVPGAGLDLVYPAGAPSTTTPPTLIESVIAALSSSVNAIASTTEGVTKVNVVLPGSSSGTGTLGVSDGDHTTGGTTGTFGGSSDEDDSKNKDKGNNDAASEKPAEKPAAKKLSVCS